MAAADDIITIPRLREAMGIVGDSEDSRLDNLRSIAIAHIEKKTGRVLVTTSQRVWTAPEDFEYLPAIGDVPDRLKFRVTDVFGDVWLYGVRKDQRLDWSLQFFGGYGKLSNHDNPDKILIAEDYVILYPPDNEQWQNSIRLENPRPRIFLYRGIQMSGALTIPKQFGEAVIIIARMLYDGSGYESIPSNSILDMILAPFIQRLPRGGGR